MSVAFTVLSALGGTVFFHAGAWPVALVFVGLLGSTWPRFFVTLGVKPFERLLGLIRLVTGLWLMYLTFAVTLSGFAPPLRLPPRHLGSAGSHNVRCRLLWEIGLMLSCLIVDDSPAFVLAARSLLERQGVTVVGEASNSDQALQQVDALRPDVTLVDIDLGGQSGFDVVRRLRREANPPTSPMILISTHAEQDYLDLIAASPATGFLAKSALSADAIRELLQREDDDAGSVGEP